MDHQNDITNRYFGFGTMNLVKLRLVTIGLGLALVGCSGGESQKKWHVLPAPSAADLNGVVCLPSGEVWVAGADGTLLTYKEGKWESPNIYLNADILSLCRAPNNELWAGLGYGRLLRYNGQAWLEVRQQYSAENITVMFFTADGTGYAAGDGGDVLRWQNGAWEKMCTTQSPILGLGFDRAGNLRAFCDNSFWIYDGSEWKREDVGVDFEVRGFAATPGGELWSFNQNNCFRLLENWRGLGNPAQQPIWAAAFTSEASGWAVGDGGAIICWDGKNWRREASPTSGNLRAIDFIGGKEGWAVGVEGLVLHYY